mgnify:CR=1 FL=1
MQHPNALRLEHHRASARLIRGHLAANPEFQPRYDAVKRIIHLFGRPAFYEISDRCNLTCEGCYFFDPAVFQGEPHDRTAFDAGWDGFLAREAARGVTMPYFLGAEPALEERRLIAAARHFRRGNIGTNGTVRLHPDIPFRISISAWAADAGDDARLRGGSAFRKALRLYQGDRRAIVLFTVNRDTVAQARAVAAMCRDHGLPLTFSLWSPTSSLLSRLATFTGNDDAFFRISTPDSSLIFSDADLMRVRDALDTLIDDFPDTVVYSRTYNRWSTAPGPLYALDPDSGIAETCGSRIIGGFRYHGLDLQPKAVKCCTPAVECRDCRLYSGGWSSQFTPNAAQVATAEAFGAWLDMILTVGRIFLRPETDPEAFVPAPAGASGPLHQECLT